ncbi:MAG TPA: ornithine cyclodeaminase family protein [Candidatus Dormibacteraeota bacterium]|nr:ornithine cyclodeaminase family protein [Candidatus Dormibacteraeota bacterium]
MEVLMLSQADVRRLLDPDRLLDALEEGFRAISSGAVDVPPRVAANTPDGSLWAMLGYGRNLGLATKLVSVFPGGQDRGIPLHQALICLFDPATGAPLAVMDGIRITAIRTAGASAVSVRHLARGDARVLAIIGAGVQGAAHLEMLPRVRDFAEIRIASRTFEHATALASSDGRARAVGSYLEAVRDADVVALCTQADETIVRREWLAPGTHVTSVGLSPKGELDRRIAEEARLYVESRAAAFQPPPVGCMELVGMAPESASEIGELLLGKAAGRQSRDELTAYKSMGHAIEDVAAAGLVYEAARRESAGSGFDL